MSGMGTVFKILLIILGGAVVLGGIIAFVAIRRARDGFEDDEGFHPTHKK